MNLIYVRFSSDCICKRFDIFSYSFMFYFNVASCSIISVLCRCFYVKFSIFFLVCLSVTNSSILFNSFNWFIIRNLKIHCLNHHVFYTLYFQYSCTNDVYFHWQILKYHRYQVYIGPRIVFV